MRWCLGSWVYKEDAGPPMAEGGHGTARANAVRERRGGSDRAPESPLWDNSGLVATRKAWKL